MKYVINCPHGRGKVNTIIAQITPDIKTIGIFVPPFFGVEEQYKFFDSLCRVRINNQLVIIPTPIGSHIDIPLPKGVTGVYIYEHHHGAALDRYDLQVRFVKDGIEFTTKDPGDKFVVSDKLKNVISKLVEDDFCAHLNSDKVPGMLFSRKSLKLRS